MRFGGPLSCALGLMLGCSRASPEVHSAARPLVVASAATNAAVPGPRLFPPTRGAGTQEAGIEQDGSRRVLSFGLRALEHPDGSLEVGEELLPSARSARFLELPPRLGGGFLFWILSSSGTLLFRASNWTAKLEPLARLDFEVEKLVAGFDRLLILPRHESEFRALDLDSGRPLPAAGLPAAPAYGSTAFVDGWFGAVQVPLRGLLLSFDAGASWHPLPLAVTSFEPSGAELSLATAGGDYSLSAKGLLSRVADHDDERVSAEAQAELSRLLSAPPVSPEHGAEATLQTAVLTGVPDGRGGAFLATGGALLHVSLQSGRVLERRDRAYVGGAECQGVRLGDGLGFVCGQAEEATRIYRVTTPLGLTLVRELAGARAVSDSASGFLAVRGGCSDARALRSVCVVAADGSARQLELGADTDRVIPLADGRVALLAPPAARTPGKLTLFGAAGASSVPLSVTSREPRHKSLLEHGVWLDGVIESKPGVLSGWLVGAGPLAGYELSLDGKLSLRRVQDGAAHALFAGRRALLLGENGLAAETTDGGVEWQGVELPPEIDLKRAQAAGARQGCSALGCGFAGFTRVGYFDGRAARTLPTPTLPSRVAFPGPGGSRWLLHCAATGETSPQALPFRTPRPLSGRRLHQSAAGDELEFPPLSPFLEQAAPRLPESFDGVDAGTEPYGVQLRLYAYGPRRGDWSKNGSFSIAFVDRFSAKGGVHSTTSGRSPWPDATTAADALGAEPSTSAAGLQAALDPSGNSGALLLSSRGTMDLFLFETGRVPEYLSNVGRAGLGPRFAGVVKTKLGVFLGSYDESSRAFRIYRVVGRELAVALEVTDIPPARGPAAELVRSAAGDALAIWVRSGSWFVHPVDLESGSVDAPYVVTPDQIASMPAPCAEDTEGFLLSGPVTPDPNTDVSGGVNLRSFEGRFRVSALGVCLDALTAQGDAGAEALKAGDRQLRMTGRPTVLTTLNERKPLGRRMELRCSN